MRGCPFCDYNEGWVQETSYDRPTKYKVVCNVCGASGPEAKTYQMAEKKWDGLLGKIQDDDKFQEALNEKQNPKIIAPSEELENIIWDVFEKRVSSDIYDEDIEAFEELSNILKNKDTISQHELHEITQNIIFGKVALSEEDNEYFTEYLYTALTGEPNLFEDMGGVSSPGATLTNTPGMGSAVPAPSAGLNTDGPAGSGDKWGDSSIGMQTNESQDSKMYENKIEVNVEKDWTGKYLHITAYDINYDLWQELGDNLDKSQLDMSDQVEKEYGIKRTSMERNLPTDVSQSDYGYADKIGTWSASTIEDVKNWLKLHKNKIYSNSTILYENNLNPYDKIGAMMAKKMGVPQPFKKKSSRTNTIEQKHYDELDEDQPDNTRSFDDYVARPDEVLNNAKKRKVNEDVQDIYRIPTLDSYEKAAQHVPVHPLEKRKGKKLQEGEALRDENALKDVKGKDELTQLGIAFEVKPGKSGFDRVFVTEPMKDVLSKIEQSDWEELGRNPENTIRKFEKGDEVLTIYAEGKDLPRVTLTSKVEVAESYKIKKIVSNSLDPYME